MGPLNFAMLHQVLNELCPLDGEVDGVMNGGISGAQTRRRGLGERGRRLRQGGEAGGGAVMEQY